MTEKFHENLKAARIRAGLTQAQLAEIIGVAKSTYSLYESGKREPDVQKIRALASALNVTGDALLGLPAQSDDFHLFLSLKHDLGEPALRAYLTALAAAIEKKE